MKVDERPAIRRQAMTARLVSLACLIVPIAYLGSSFKYENQQNAWTAYTASPLYAADQATVADVMADRYDRQHARDRLQQPTSPELSPFDLEFWIAAFFHLIVIVGASIRVPAPITQEERQALMFKERGRKAAATRRANKAKSKVVELRKAKA